ncbi:uncharacterized protein LOC132628490 [Lycium barbarum]|uniref:uncharacterized protein LOC132628490 n=1 Tax=Lycium barbarum TaxID=112863 RepID=UPI00293F1477|nr:uncharacterized protein LOC132628490 [Lycium barbarum]
MQPGIDIARIHAYAQGVEDRRCQREAISEPSSSQPKRARSEGKNKGPTRESKPQYSAPLQFRGPQRGRETSPRQRQGSSYVSGSQQQMRSEQEVMPPPRCASCRRRHVGRCRQGVCYTCGNPWHYARDCPQRVGSVVPENSAAASSPSVRAHEAGLQTSSSRGRGGGRAPSSCAGQHRIYALGGRPGPDTPQDAPSGIPFFK